MPKSYAPQVRTYGDPDFTGNALRFPTREEAQSEVSDLARRWTAVVDTRVVESNDPPNYRWVDGRLVDMRISAPSSAE